MKSKYLKYIGTFTIRVTNWKDPLVKWNTPHDSRINSQRKTITIKGGRINQYSANFIEFFTKSGTRFYIMNKNIKDILDSNKKVLFV